MGEKLFCKADSISREILAYACEAGLKVINVKQGYPACTVLKISDTRAITSDNGMAKALRSEGIEVLAVPESDKILLPPYKNGFIGGTAGRCSNTVYFAGNPKALPYFDTIDAFAQSAGVKLLSLYPESSNLIDLGSLVFCK